MNKEQGTKAKLSLGIIVLSVWLIFLGVSSFLKSLNNAPVWNLTWAILGVASGVGLLAHKFWALRLTQAYFVLTIITSFFIFYSLPNIAFGAKMGILIATDTFAVLILWYLSKRNTVAQFIDFREATDFGEQTGQKLDSYIQNKGSLRPVLSGLSMVIWYGSQIFLFLMMVDYFFEWWGNWAYLLILGIFLGIPFLDIVTWLPVFPIIFWLHTRIFPVWFFVLWGIGVAAMIFYGLLQKDDFYYF